jgi:transketolase
MGHWVKHSLVEEYSISADWDDKWRHGGNLEEVIEEAHLSSDWQMKGMERFARDRDKRIKRLQESIPVDLLEKMRMK